MNGNVKAANNDKDKNGKRCKFTLIDNKTADVFSARNAIAFLLYRFIRSRADTDYNLTAENLARDLQSNVVTISKNIKILREMKLLKVEREANKTGKTRVLTAGGSPVPNNSRLYTVYALPYEIDKETEIIANVDFTEDLKELEGADVYDFTVDLQEVAEDMPILAETKASIAKEAPKKQIDKSAEAKRIAEIKEIGASRLVFGQAQNTLVDAVKRFASTVGRIATNAEITEMADFLSGNSQYNFTSYFERKKKAEIR